MAFYNRYVRRSALLSPWGVGSIVPFPNDESLMIAGLDAWRYNDEKPFLIEDKRLMERLGVSEFRWPPDFRDRNEDPVNAMLTIPAVRFPRWHYCPFCGTMVKATFYQQQPRCPKYQWTSGRSCDPNRSGRRMIPDRFVAVCIDGHIEDFPIAEWIHSDGKHKYDPRTCVIRRSTGGATSMLSGIKYSCSCGAHKSMANAMSPGALANIGYKCKGSKPWLGIEEDDENPCNRDDLQVMLRGATNVWFPDTRSSIFIPPDWDGETNKIKRILEKYWNILSEEGREDDWVKNSIMFLAADHNVDEEGLRKAFFERKKSLDNLVSEVGELSEEEYREAEYKVLKKSSGDDDQQFQSIYYPISEYNKVLHKYFKGISLIPKLRETRAFAGFSRRVPRSDNLYRKKKMLSRKSLNWLPAIEVYGEGIFFEFDTEPLREWASNSLIQERAKKLGQQYGKSFFSGEKNNYYIRAEFILIHTFAHLLINQLAFECGYGSSSIRERIYCEKSNNVLDMAGVLIYTASGDSEGSLGGLVRQGKSGRIEDTIISALINALWCTSDPICIQSTGQGTDSCNLAACHNCAILPETCCEEGNRLLDRAMVVGTLDEPDIGFFSDVRYLT
jgi:hypothetical protein